MTGWPGTALALFWGFAEGTLFFILPDVPLSFVAMFRPRRALLHMAGIVAGALLAGGVMFAWSARSDEARIAVLKVPAVSQSMFDRAEADWNRYGAWGVALGPVRGIPYKVYAVQALGHMSLGRFLVVTVPARLWRFVLVWIGFAGAGLVLRKVGRASWAPLLHAAFWIVTYAIYWTTV
jgi:membrane protein YqaA with SNARE-associated domain